MNPHDAHDAGAVQGQDLQSGPGQVMPLPGMAQAAPPQAVPIPPPAGQPAAHLQPGPGGPAGVSWLPPTVPVGTPAEAGNQKNQTQHQDKTGNTGQQSAAGPSGVPATADDGDLIEKDWVMRAKQIIGQYRQDPYMQTKELHKFRAEYMKKRYNKEIEPVDD